MSLDNQTKLKNASFAEQRKILVTAALPYANGSIHLGHLLEHIQADTWVRAQKMANHQVLFLCAEDAHGTAIMLRAEKERRSPEELINASQKEHLKDFKNFSINFDNYYTTHSQENRQLVEMYYERLNKAGLIEIKNIEQAYDPVKSLFLADRFIKGKCPRCDAVEQYGDSCEACGATYSPREMKEAYSVLSNARPIWKKSQHYFFKLSDPKCLKMLREWIENLTQNETKNKLKEWLEPDRLGNIPLEDWDISRDAPYFGFEIPNAPGKFFYVWLDAPIGYLACLKNFCKKENFEFNAWTDINSDTEQYHFIGKDILYFHALFWPAMCFGAGFRLPTNIYAHGFLTVNGKKMSKSRGTFITARAYLDCNLDPDALRYYFCAKLNGSISDIDFNLSDFVDRINSDLIGKYVNIASRSSKFLSDHFNNKLHGDMLEEDLLKKIRLKCSQVSKHFFKLEYSQAVREIMEASNNVNLFIDREKPWNLAKHAPYSLESREKLHRIVSTSIEAFRLISIMLKPISPKLLDKVEQFLNVKTTLSWESANTSLPDGHKINPYTHLLQRIDKTELESQLKKRAK